MRLYHFTCADHGEPGIRRHRLILPNWHPIVGRKLIWLTDNPRPERDHVGLTSSMLACDRMAYRVGVEVPAALIDGNHVQRWMDSSLRRYADVGGVFDLESYGAPHSWWVSLAPLTAGDIVRMRETVT